MDREEHFERMRKTHEETMAMARQALANVQEIPLIIAALDRIIAQIAQIERQKVR